MHADPDVLSQLASAFRLEGAMGGRFSLASPWGFALPRSEHVVLLVVLRGRVHFESGEEESRTFELGAGDVVALPHGDAHVVRDDPRTLVKEAGGLRSCPHALPRHPRGGETELLVLACRFANGSDNSLLRALPRVIRYAGRDGAVVRWLEPTIELLATESAANAPGRTMILDRLAEVVFLQLVRTWLENDDDCKGWLRALRDSRIQQVLSAMHAEPGKTWTVESLAQRAGMSRSAFASRFRELVGETPLDYLTRWRMQRAAALIRVGEAPLKEVIAMSGYTSEAAFRVAFRKWAGVAPGEFRVKARGEGEAASSLARAGGVGSSPSVG